MNPIPLFFQLLGWTSWQTSVNTAAKSTLKLVEVLSLRVIFWQIMKIIPTLQVANQMKNDPRSCKRNLCNCIRSLIYDLFQIQLSHHTQGG